MIDLEQFKKNAIERGLCQGYTDKWTSEKSNRELFEIACDANGAEFMAASVAEGWGVSPEYFAKKFKAYINANIKMIKGMDTLGLCCVNTTTTTLKFLLLFCVYWIVIQT